jgi:hypothetical protein
MLAEIKDFVAGREGMGFPLFFLGLRNGKEKRRMGERMKYFLLMLKVLRGPETDDFEQD